MKIIIAPDSFKGSLSSQDVCETVSRAARDAFSRARATGAVDGAVSGEAPEIVCIPIADGGEGTVESVLAACGGRRVTAAAHDPLGRPMQANYGIIQLPDGQGTGPFGTDPQNHAVAVLETAAASGLTLVNEQERNVLQSSTYGTGELLMDAVRRGYRTVYLGLGGSATNDGGMGLAAALGARFLDADGAKLRPAAASLQDVASVDLSGIAPDVSGAGADSPVRIVIMSDVQNPLLGPKGATAVYGPQKGVTPDLVAPLDAAMADYADAVERATGRTCRDVPGAGAAGGLGFGLLAFTDAEIRSGVDVVLDLAGFDAHLAAADLVVTGEGRMDASSAYGKAAAGVARRCKAAGVPCVAIVGCTGDGADEMYRHSITEIVTTGQGLSHEEAMRTARPRCYDAAYEFFYKYFRQQT
ncbi:MAG: glycerate kinase [Mogibacterium sp.]|nr:glycerate kinase [Mogibacterium sp.]